MGHREQLLAGAKRCLYEKGYARITARDLVAASGTNLASIGYHFGSKEALLTTAMIEASSELGDEVERAASMSAEGDPAARLEALLTQFTELWGEHRPLWSASFESFAQAQHIPALREQLAAAFEEGRHELAAAVLDVDEGGVGEQAARTVGSLAYALAVGLMVQRLVDSERAPSGHDLAEALRMMSGATRPGGEEDPGEG